MKKFIISEEEKKTILSMHKSLVNEQESKTPVEDVNLTKLRNSIKVGCLTNGRLKRDSSKNIYFYRKPSATGTGDVDFFADMTYKFVDGSKSGKWKCEGLTTLANTTTQVASQKAGQQTEIDLLKKQFDWKERKELSDIGEEELTQLYQKHPKFELYKLKVQSGKAGGYTTQQQSFIAQAKTSGYVEKLSDDQIATGTYKEYKVPNSEKYFPGGLTMFWSPSTAVQSGEDIESQFKQMGSNQRPTSRRDCAKTIKTYYDAWEEKLDFSPTVFEPMKRKVTACINTFGKKYSSLGGILSNTDNYIETLSGGSGGPLSYGEDAKWRLK